MNKLFKVTILSGLLTLLKMLMGFIIAKVIAVYTGPSGMAMLGQVQNAVNGFNGIINAPVGNGIVRFTAEKGKDGLEHCVPWWRASFQWVIIIFFVLSPCALFFSKGISIWLFESNEYSWVVKLIVVFLPLCAIGTLCSSVINGLQNYKRFIGLGAISVLISSLLMICMIIFYGILGAIIAAVSQTAIIGLVMLIANLKQPWGKITYWFGRSNQAAKISILHYILMALTSAILAPLSLIMIRNQLIDSVGWEQAGLWQAVWKISEVYLGVITIALGTYFLPKLSSLDSSEVIFKEINKTAIIIVPIAALLALIVYMSRDIAIAVLFTKEFNSSRDLFFIQLCGDIIKMASWIYAYPMIAKGIIKWYIPTELIFSVTFIALGHVLIPKYGLEGANYAYALNYLIYFIFMFLFIKRIIK